MTRRHLVTLGVLATAAGCSTCLPSSSPPTHGDYWSRGCVTGDGALLVMAGDETVAVDAATGTLKFRSPSFYGEPVLCAQSTARAWFSDEVLELPAGTRAPAPPPYGALGLKGGAPFGFHRPTRKGSPTGPLEVFAADRTTTVPRERFGALNVPERGVQGALGENMLFVSPRPAALPDGRLFVVAGLSPNVSPGEVEALPWGFAFVDTASGAVTVWGWPRPSRLSMHLRLSQWNVAVTADGSLAAATAGNPTRLLVYEQKDAAPLSETTLDGRETTALALTPTLAVAATLDQGGEHSRVVALEPRTGKQRWASAELDGSVRFLEVMGDGSVLAATSKREVLRFDGATGAVRVDTRP
jgi:hypothetical protein